MDRTTDAAGLAPRARIVPGEKPFVGHAPSAAERRHEDASSARKLLSYLAATVGKNLQMYGGHYIQVRRSYGTAPMTSTLCIKSSKPPASRGRGGVKAMNQKRGLVALLPGVRRLRRR